MQRTVQKRHVAVGRNDVGAVGLHLYAVFDFKDLHASIAPDQIGQDALVIGCQMLHQHKSHAGVFVNRHAGKERFKSSQTPCGSADADDGEVGFDWDFSDSHFHFSFSSGSFRLYDRFLFSGCHRVISI